MWAAITRRGEDRGACYDGAIGRSSSRTMKLNLSTAVVAHHRPVSTLCWRESQDASHSSTWGVSDVPGLGGVLYRYILLSVLQLAKFMRALLVTRCKCVILYTLLLSFSRFPFSRSSSAVRALPFLLS